MRIRFFLPLTFFFIMVFILYRGMYLRPNEIPSPLINNPTPLFTLPTLKKNKMINNKDFIGHITLLNVWATWCPACIDEHAFLIRLSNQKTIQLYGLDYKDDPEFSKKWLKKYGNPYQLVAIDPQGQASLDWGVYGTPETFVIDKKGMIRYKLIGPLTETKWRETVEPLVAELRNE